MAITPGQREIVRKRALELLTSYYEAPQGLSIERLVEILPGPRVKAIMDQPWFGQLLESRDDPFMLGVWLRAMEKASFLYAPDLAAIRAAQAESYRDTWKADFGNTPYSPTLLREALFSAGADGGPSEAEDGDVTVENA